MTKISLDSKLNLVIVVSLFFLIILGCQSEDGELLPIDGEGVEIATSRFENDTALINDNGLKIKVYGSWSGNNYIQIRVAIFNEFNQRVQIKFDQTVLKNSNNQTASISDIDEKPSYNSVYGNTKNQNIPAISLNANEKKSFLMSFAPVANIANAEESAKTFSFSLPIEADGKTKTYNVQFKAVDRVSDSGKTDPEDW